jgi:hypothetical protein
MIDVLAIPGLAILVVGFVVYIWVVWLKDKDGRALNIPQDDEGDDPPRFHD